MRTLRFLFFLLPGLVWAAEEPDIWRESVSDSKQYRATSHDDLLNSVILDLALETRQRLGSFFNLERKWKFPVHVIVRPGPADAPPRAPDLVVNLRQKKLAFEIRLTTPPSIVTEELLRVLITTCAYEKALQNRENFQENQTLPVLPLWVTEGALQWLQNTHQEDWDLVLRRADSLNSAPSLTTVATWDELSADPIQRAWQQAFCYRLFQLATQGTKTSETFGAWLQQLDGDAPARRSAVPSSVPTHDPWSPNRRLPSAAVHEMIWSWDQTASRLSSLLSFSLRDPQDQTVILTTIDKLRSVQKHPNFNATVNAKRLEFIQLELIAAPEWRPVLMTYRAALEKLFVTPAASPPPAQAAPSSSAAKGTKSAAPTENPKAPSNAKVARPASTQEKTDIDGYETLIHAAQQETLQLQERHTKVTDYLNWFEITYPVKEVESPLTKYFIRQRLVEVEDRRALDPIKQEILRIEKGL
jgi:hypothetical protein